MEEVDKLLIVGFIREIHYPEGLAKHRHGKKKKKNLMENGGRNSVCPKDSFPKD